MFKAPSRVAWIASGALAVLGLVTPVPATATETIIKVPLSDGGFDVAYDGITFGTLSDGDGLTIGEQNTRVVFTGILEGFSDISDANASFSLSDVSVSAGGSQIGPVIVNETTGGSFNLWDPSNNLLLSGTLGDGAITGSSTQSTGSFFTTAFSAFTGGSLAALLDPNSAALSMALSGIFTDGSPGLRLADGILSPFSADGTLAITATPGSEVPEPMTGVLLLGGLMMGALIRKRAKA